MNVVDEKQEIEFDKKKKRKPKRSKCFVIVLFTFEEGTRMQSDK